MILSKDKRIKPDNSSLRTTETLNFTSGFSLPDSSHVRKQYRFFDHYDVEAMFGYNKPNAGSSDEEKNGEGNAIYHIKNNMYTT